MSNEALQAIPMLALFAEAGAAIWAFARKDLKSIVLVNALAAAGVMLFIAPELSVSIKFVDVILLLQVALLTFALATLTTSLSWFAFPDSQPWLVWSEFSVVAGLSLAVLAFVSALGVARLI